MRTITNEKETQELLDKGFPERYLVDNHFRLEELLKGLNIVYDGKKWSSNGITSKDLLILCYKVLTK
jgi:hypothetical protein